MWFLRRIPLLLLLAAPAAHADFEAGVEAARAGDYAAARREWTPLAEGGHRDAQFNLGLLYENGLGVPADAAAAVRWYRRAAQQEDRAAQAYLGEMYAKGLGVPRDDAEALTWFRRAAENGHPAAQYNVGVFYATGRAVPPDAEQAYAWLTVAIERKAPDTGLRDLLARHMSAAGLANAKSLAQQVRQQCRLE